MSQSKISLTSLKKLPRQFYDRDTIAVANDLLGKFLIHRTQGKTQIAKIVEVEAYLGEHDLAAHSSKGLTERTKVMFGAPGHAYVYLIYGMYHCVNVVTEKKGNGSAVLIRAVEPIQNIDERTQGPGLLCKAMYIDKRLQGHDLLSSDFYLAKADKPESFVTIKKPRVGVDYAKHWARRLLRFYIKDNAYVSKR